MAEPSVARIARLLVRHTQQFRNWPDTLPMVAFALNCTEHLSTGVSPFFALYGRHPITLPELENPSLVELTETGNEFVDTLATRLRQQAWPAVLDTFESIRLDADARADAYHRRWLKPNIMDSVGGIVQVGEHVLLRHGNIEYAALLKKHGFSPLRSFRVLEVTGYKRVPDDWWIFDDSPTASGRFDAPATTFAAHRGNPYEVGGGVRWNPYAVAETSRMS
eukprot:5681484-Pleurochrysis_carterae.AAC.2